MEIKSKYVTKYKKITGEIVKYPLHYTSGIYFKGDYVTLINHPSLKKQINESFKIKNCVISYNQTAQGLNYSSLIYILHGLNNNYWEYISCHNIILYKRPLKNWFKYIKMLITRIYVP